jgi:hypothetical protein
MVIPETGKVTHERRDFPIGADSQDTPAFKHIAFSHVKRSFVKSDARPRTVGVADRNLCILPVGFEAE